MSPLIRLPTWNLFEFEPLVTFLTAYERSQDQQSSQMSKGLESLIESLKPVVALAICFLVSGCAYGRAAGRPTYSGHWELDSARSPSADAAAIFLVIKDESNKITYQRSLTTRDGKKLDVHFACPVDGTQCDLVENGHKASVSLWYDGSALMILKTNGPKRDSTTERRLELSPDGKTLKVR